MNIDRILAEERELARFQLEDKARERFKAIINGKGCLVPRIAVKIAIDDIFGSQEVGEHEKSTCLYEMEQCVRCREMEQGKS